MPTDWFYSGCGSGPGVRILDDGRFEFQGQAVPKQSLPPKVNDWVDTVFVMANRYQIWPHFVAGIMGLESRGDPKASSGVAYGLMQLITQTASNFGGDPDPSTASGYKYRSISPNELLDDPVQNIEIGCRYITYLTNKYNNPIKVSAAYNAGGAYCGSSCLQRETPGDKNSSCLDRCDPNEWNLVTDCYQHKSVNYPRIVLQMSNDAWEGAYKPTFGEEKPPLPPPSPPPSGGGGGGGEGLILLAGAAVLGALALAAAAAAPRRNPRRYS